MPNPVPAGPITAALSTKTPSGCEFDVHAVSGAPLSLDLKHSAECQCRGRERYLVQDYILGWVLYRVKVLMEHPARSCTRARVACELLGLDGLEPVLDKIDAIYPL